MRERRVRIYGSESSFNLSNLKGEDLSSATVALLHLCGSQTLSRITLLFAIKVGVVYA